MPKKVTGARVEPMTDADFKFLGISRPPLAQPTDRDRLATLKREKDEVKREALRAVESRAAELAGLDSRLPREVLDEERKRIRQKHEAVIERARRRAGEIADEVEGAAGYWSRSEVLRRSRFDPDPVKDSTVRSAWMSRIGRANEPALLQFAREAVSEGNVPLVGVIAEELAARPDLDRALRREIGAVLDTVRTASEEIAPLLHELRNARYELLAVDGNARNKIAAGLASRGVTDTHPKGTLDNDEGEDEDADATPVGLTGGQIAIHRGLLQRQGRRGDVSEVEEPDESDGDPDAEPTSTQKISDGLKQRRLNKE